MNKSIGLIIQNKREEIAEIARQNSIEFIGLFGSYSRGEQTSQSDLDLLIKFNFNNRSISLFSLYDIQEKLEKLFNKNWRSGRRCGRSVHRRTGHSADAPHISCRRGSRHRHYHRIAEG